MLLASLLLLASVQLPTGKVLDPALPSIRAGHMPLGVAVSNDGRYAALLLCGYRVSGVQIVDLRENTVTATLEQPAAFLGIAFSPDGKTLWTSAGNEDAIYRYTFANGVATFDTRIALGIKDPKKGGRRYPAQLALSADGARVYVAENLSDTVAVIDAASNRVVQRLPAGRYPYGIAVAGDDVFVSAWGEHAVHSFHVNAAHELEPRGPIAAGRHPSALLAANGRLYVASATTDSIAIIDIASHRVITTLHDAAPRGPHEGTTPNALAIAGDNLYVAEADTNAVAIFSTTTNALLGRVPVDWYPTALATSNGMLLVASGKGLGTAPNPHNAQPGQKAVPGSYTLGQLEGSLTKLPLDLNAYERAWLSRRTVAANGWTRTRGARRHPPFRHVIYVIKENRTYDQILGDVKEADGDASLVFFPKDVTPNHHAIAARFGIFDRFFVNAEVSADGHNWSTAAYASDYTTKTIPQEYGGKGRSYDYEGTNRGVLLADDEDDVASPSTGYLWDMAIRKGLTLRNYGEYGIAAADLDDPNEKSAQVTKRALRARSNPEYAPYDLSVMDQTRIDVWLRDFRGFVAKGSMPALQIVRLPNDHTMGAKAGQRTPRAYLADNDLAFGRLVDAVSHSRFWKDTVIVTLEDDAQNGPDHVDSHRSLLFVASAYNRPGVVHRFVNTTDVLATIEEILGLDSMSQFDHFGRPLRELFTSTPDLTPYTAITPAIDLQERNPEKTAAAKASEGLDLRRADDADDELLNRALWLAIKGDEPYPGPTRGSLQAIER